MSEERNQLFVEDEDMIAMSDAEDNSDHFHEAHEEQPNSEDDPIIESIPIILNNLPKADKQSLHLIQFVGRPKNRVLDGQELISSIKPESQVLGVSVPLDTSTFYDQSRSEQWGVDVLEHNLQGVLGETEDGLYAAKIVVKDNQRKLVLVPINSSAQLRPSFKYLDDIDNAKNMQRKPESADSQKPANVQILQTSAKASTQANNLEGFNNNALGESLKFIKRFEEEEWLHLRWKGYENPETESIRKYVEESAQNIELETDTTSSEYIQMLIQ